MMEHYINSVGDSFAYCLAEQAEVAQQRSINHEDLRFVDSLRPHF